MEEKSATLEEKDTIWTSMRHMHMKDTIDKLMQDFNKFCHEHANFTDKSSHPQMLLTLERKRRV